MLFYGTAGGAFGNIQANASGTAFQKYDRARLDRGRRRRGLHLPTIGRRRVEYLYVDLENASFTNPVVVSETVKFDASLIRLGIDYKFR